jgi:isochorismate synthase
MQEVLKHTDSIAEALRICLGKKIHFAAYRLPGKTGIDLIIQKDPEMRALENLTDRLPSRGFLIAPFSRNNDKTYLIRPEIVLHNSFTSKQLEELLALPENLLNQRTQPCPEDTRKEDYIHLIRDTIGRINSGEFEKVVLSRVKTVQGNFSKRLPDIFNILCNSYPNAFVYLFCLNGQCWTGATPEPFICSKGEELITVSLAGTRAHRKEDLDIGNWNRKELQEQDYVTLHIEKILKNYTVSAYTKNGPYVARAGNLLHLRTDFTFSVQSVGNQLPSLINALHPTPAVCGMSTGKAMDFIGSSEKHSREYYTGFLGPLGLGDLIHLYVNLRCLKVYDNRVLLYIGGGITHDSVAEEEWEETEIKADTLLSVLQQIK